MSFRLAYSREGFGFSLVVLVLARACVRREVGAVECVRWMAVSLVNRVRGVVYHWSVGLCLGLCVLHHGAVRRPWCDVVLLLHHGGVKRPWCVVLLLLHRGGVRRPGCSVCVSGGSRVGIRPL